VQTASTRARGALPPSHLLVSQTPSSAAAASSSCAPHPACARASCCSSSWRALTLSHDIVSSWGAAASISRAGASPNRALYSATCGGLVDFVYMLMLKRAGVASVKVRSDRTLKVQPWAARRPLRCCPHPRARPSHLALDARGLARQQGRLADRDGARRAHVDVQQLVGRAGRGGGGGRAGNGVSRARGLVVFQGTRRGAKQAARLQHRRVGPRGGQASKARRGLRAGMASPSAAAPSSAAARRSGARPGRAP
jgi:hypothetical protein